MCCLILVARANRNQPSSQQVASPSKTSRPESAPRHCQAPFLAATASAKAPSPAKLNPRLHCAPSLCQAQLLASAKLVCAGGYTHVEIIWLPSYLPSDMTKKSGGGGADYDIIGQIIYDIIESVISCNSDIIDSEIWYHSFKSMISYMILHMILSMISYVYDIT